MNRQTYRLIYSRLRGMLVAVSEAATAAGKACAGETSSGCIASSQVVSVLWLSRDALFGALALVGVLAGALVMMMTLAQAQIVPGGTHAPSVIQTQNGLPQVNVNRPSGAGVSVNTYNQFDVQKPGAVLNNSPTLVQTQQAGYINGNPNYLPGQSASIIVNQVNSNNPSQLRGYIEVAGKRAEVVVAAPSGLIVDGGGFINTSRAVLTTGTPTFGANGGLTGFDVSGGQITVQGAGLNASNLDQVDLIARAIAANAAIYGTTLNVIAGANHVDHDTLSATPIAGNGPSPTVAIDVSQLGGMYANRIFLVSNENGVGVSNKGVIAAQAGDLTLTTQGQLVLAGKTNASGNIIASARDGVDNSGTTYAQQSVALNTSGTLTNTGTLAAQQNTSVNAGAVSSTGTLGAGINSDGSIAQSGDLTVAAAGALNATGHNAAGGRATLAGAALNLGGSLTSANGQVTLLANNGDMNLAGASVISGGALAATAQGALTTDHGMVSSTGAQTLSSASLSNQGGQIISQSTLDVNAGGAVNNRQGIIQSAGNEHISAGSLDDTAGRVVMLGSGTESIAIAGALVNAGGTTATGTAGGVIGSNGALNVAAGSISNQGQLNALADASVQAQSIDNHAGGMTAGGTLGVGSVGALNNQNGTLSGSTTNVSGSSVDNSSGTIEGNTLALSTSGDLVNRGGHLTQYGSANQTIAAGGTIDDTGGSVASNATNLNISAQSLVNDSGSIQHAGAGTLALTAVNSVSNAAGNVVTNGALDVTGATVSNQGTMSAKSDAVVHAQTLDNHAGSLIAGGKLTATGIGALSNQNGMLSGSSTTISAASIDDASGTIEGNQLAVSTIGDFNNRSGHLTQYGNANQTIAAGGTFDDTGGTVATNATNLNVSAQSIVNDSGSIQHAGTGTLALTAANTVSNSGGTVVTNGALNVTGTSVANQGTMSAKGDATVRARTLDNDAGSVIAGGNLTATGIGALNNQAGMLSGSATRISAASIDDTNGTIEGNQLAVSATGDIVNRGGHLTQYGSADQTIAAGGGIDNSGGVIATNATNLTVSGQSITDDAGSIQHAGTGTLALGAVNSVSNAAGTVVTNGALDVTGTTVSNQGTMSAKGDAVVHAQTLNNNTGSVIAGGNITATGIGALSNQAGTLSGSATRISAASIDDTNGTIEGNQLAVSATGDLVNRGGHLTQYGNADQTITAGGGIDNSSGVIATNAANLDVSAQSIVNDVGSIQHAGTGTLALTAVGAGSSQASSSVSNSNGTVVTNGTLDVTGGAVSNQGTMSAKGNATVQAQTLDNHAGSVVTGGNLSATSVGALNNQNGTLSGAATSVSGASIDNSNGTIEGTTLALSTSGNLSNRSGHLTQYASADQTISVGGAIDNSGGIVATNATNLTVSGQSITNDAGVIQHAGTGTLSITTPGALSDVGGQIATNGALTAHASSLDNSSGTLSAQGTAQITADTGLTNQGGTLYGKTGLNASTQGTFNNAQGSAQTSGNLVMSAGGALSNAQGTISANGATGSATVSAASIDNTAGKLTDSGTGATTITAATGVTNSGGILGGNGDVTVNAQTLTNDSNAKLVAGGTANLNTTNSVNNSGGTIYGGTGLNLNQGSAAVINDGGQFEGGQDVSVQVASLSNAGGAIKANRDITVSAATNGGITGNGAMSAGRNLALAVTGDYTNSASSGISSGVANGLHADGNMTVSATGTLTNTGTLAAGGALTATGANVVNAAGADIDSAATTVNASGTLTNAGRIEGDAVTTHSATLANTGTVIGNTVEIDATDVQNTGATAAIAAAQALNIYASNSVTNSDGALMYSGGTLAIARDGVRDGTGMLADQTGTLTNSAATIEAVGDIDIAAHTVNNIRTGVQTQAGTPQNTGTSTLTLWTAGLSGDDLGFYQSSLYPQWNWGAGAIGTATIGALMHPITVTVPKSQVTNLDPTAQTLSFTQPLTDTYVSSSSPTVQDCNNFCVNVPVPQTRIITSNATQYYNSITDNGSTYSITLWPDYNPATNLRPDQVKVRTDLGSNNHDYVQMQTVAATTTATDQLISAGTPALLQAQGSIRINSDGGTINNDSSTMAAGGNLTRRATGGSVNDSGTVLQQTVTADTQSTYYWHQKTGGSSDTKVVDDGITQSTNTVAALPAIASANGAVQTTAQTINVASVNRVGQAVLGAGVTGSNATGTQLGSVSGQTAALSTASGVTGQAALVSAATGATGQKAGSNSAGAATGQTAGVNVATGVAGLTVRPQTLGAASGGIPNLTLPVNGLYTYQSAPSATYLIATDPRLTSYSRFISSDYMLGQLGLNPQTTEKRLGDGSYEENLVMNQVTQLTGRTYLAGYSNNLDEYTALMNNGVQYAKSFGLEPGIGLSDAQMSQLTTDMVWLVSQDVTLPDGSHQSVLVPKLYLAQADTVDLQDSGAIVTGNSVSMNATGDVNNTGHIVGDVATTVIGNNIVNSGVIGSGGTTVVSAVQDVRNVSGKIGGVDTLVAAGRDVINETATASVSTTLHDPVNGASFASSASSQSALATGTISASDNAVVLAQRDVTLAGAAIESGNSAFVGAGRNINAGTVALTATQAAGSTDGLNGGHDSVTKNVGSSITTGGDLTTVSGGNTTLTDATVKAGVNGSGSATLIAANNLTVTAATDTQTHQEQSLGGSKNQHTASSYDETTQGSAVNASDTLTLGAGQMAAAAALLSKQGLTVAADAPAGGGNLAVLGSSVTTSAPTGSTSANGAASGGAVTLAATGDATIGAVSETHDAQSWSHDEHSGFLSSDKSTDQTASHQVLSVGSTVSGDTVTANAGHDLTIAGSTVASTNDMALSAGHNLTVTTTQDTSQNSHFHEEQKSGLGGTGGAGISYGTSDTKDTTHDNAVMQNGSLVGSTNGSVSMTAGNGLHITGSDVIAAQDVTGKAASVTIDAATGTSHHDDTQETKTSGLTLGLAGSVGDAVNGAVQQSQAISSGAGDARAKALHGIAAAGDAAIAVAGATGGSLAGSNPSMAVQLSYGTSQSKSTFTEDQTKQTGSTVKAGGTASFTATGGGDTPADAGNVTIAGSNVSGNNVSLDAKNQVSLVNTTDTDSTRSTNKSSSASAGVSAGTQGFGVSAAMSNAHGDANSDAAMQNNTHVAATNTVSIKSGGDTNIVGADVSGNHVAADVGGNLNVASVQDKTVSAAHQSSTGGGFSISQGGGSASVSAQNGHADANYAGVNEQAGIQAGGGGFDIKVKGNTDLTGAYIASTADSSKNSLTTGTLTTSDIENQSHYSASSNGFSAGAGVGFTGKATGTGAVSGSGGVVPMLYQNANGDESATTKSGISAGTINITDGAHQTQDLASINRDTSNLNGTVSKTPDINTMLSAQSDMMNAAQAAGQVVAQGIGAYADTKRDDALNTAQTALDQDDLAGAASALADYDQWKEGGDSRAMLQLGGGALIGGLGGGSVFSAVGGAAGAGLSSKLAGETKSLSNSVSDATGSSLAGNVAGNILSGLGGALVGGSAGAAAASNVSLYNQGQDAGDESAADRAAKIASRLGDAILAVAKDPLGTMNSALNSVLPATGPTKQTDDLTGETWTTDWTSKPKSQLIAEGVGNGVAGVLGGPGGEPPTASPGTVSVNSAGVQTVNNTMGTPGYVPSNATLNSGGNSTGDPNSKASDNAVGATSSGSGLTAAQQLAANRAAGTAFEQAVASDLGQSGLTIGEQITIETQSGVRTRLDYLTLDPITGDVGCVECKASSTAPLTRNQTLAFPEIGQSGGTIVGAGKPGFPGGTKIPPTNVQIIRGP